MFQLKVIKYRRDVWLCMEINEIELGPADLQRQHGEHD